MGKLWAGLIPRGTRIVMATVILSKIREVVTARLGKEEGSVAGVAIVAAPATQA